MPEDNRDNNTLSVKTALGTATWSGKRVAELITILTLCVMGVLTYALWRHMLETDKAAAQTSEQYLSAMKFTSQAIVQSASAQREFACLISIPQDQRERAWETGRCRRMARIGIEE